MPNNQIDYRFVQESPIAFSVSDNDMCAECTQCAYAPGELSLCKVQLADPDQVFPGEQDGDGEIVHCDCFVHVDHQDENWLTA